MPREYIIYSDESEGDGRFYSNFYGGVLIESSDLLTVHNALTEKKAALHMRDEIKWSKVTEQYLTKYIELTDEFFDLVAGGMIKVRVMFRQNANHPEGLKPEHKHNAYHLLYYQFLKHAFGLKYSGDRLHPRRVRLYFDMLQGTTEQKMRFKEFLLRLRYQEEYQRAGILLSRDGIAEVVSHDHVILQCLDVVMGAMQFRLNNKHEEKPPGARIRGKKTRAKEKLYKHILKRIQQIYPHFNIGISTGLSGDPTNHWVDPYRHWSFLPKKPVSAESSHQKVKSPAIAMSFDVSRVELGTSREAGQS